MRVSDIRARVLGTFGDIDNVQVENQDIIRWVNDAQREIAIKHELIQIDAVHDLIGFEDSYELPDFVYKVYAVTVNNRGLIQIQVQDVSNYSEQQSGTPTSWYVWNRQLKLVPKPDRSIPNGLKIYYIRLPESVSSMDQPIKIPPEFFAYMVDYCLAQAYLLDNDKEGYAMMQNKLREHYVDMANDLINDQVNEYPQIREVYGDD